MREKIATFVLAAIAVGLPTFGQAQVPGGSPDTQAVQAGAYQVEGPHTQVQFSVMHIGFTNYGGTFANVSGQLKLDPKTPATSSLDITVPVDSVLTTSTKLDGELKGDQWLDAAKFPSMQFHSTKVTLTSANTATVAGTLTLHGVTRPIVLQAKFIGAGVNPIDKNYTVGFSASGTLNRSDYGVKTYVPLIGDEVQLTINAAFIKQ